jgi:hypothetical protein
MQLAGGQVLADLARQIRDARGQFFLIDQHDGFRTRHGGKD